MSDGATPPHAAAARWSALPLVVFVALATLLFMRLGAGDASQLPSALIGQPAPPLDLPGLDGAPGLDRRGPARGPGHASSTSSPPGASPAISSSHLLMALAADPDVKAQGRRILGVAQKDSAENIRRFLGAKGDPYAKVGLDPDSRAGIDWGVYGVPETFVVKGDGMIAFKFVGPIDAETLAERRQAGDPQGDELANRRWKQTVAGGFFLPQQIDKNRNL